MDKGKTTGIKFVIYICVLYAICFCITYELSWLLHFGKSDLIRVEATKIEISLNRHASRFTTYQTLIKYRYNEKNYEEKILTDASDWKNDIIIIYIEEDYPKRIYRDKCLVIPLSPASIGAVGACFLSIFLAVRLSVMKKEKDYKIPNP